MPKVKFDNFLERFPEAELPATLRDDSNFDFEKNDTLQPQMLEDYILPYEATEMDDFTEYLSCFRLPPQEKWVAVVYWKAGLMNYDFVIATYQLATGTMIDKKAIAGVKVEGQDVKRIIATINSDFSIVVAEGLETTGADYVADSTKTHRYEILESGIIEQDY